MSSQACSLTLSHAPLLILIKLLLHEIPASGSHSCTQASLSASSCLQKEQRACSRRLSCARCASVLSSRVLASERPSVYVSSTCTTSSCGL